MGRRSGTAQAAQHRKAGPMAHRLEPRGGSKNDQPDLIAEAEEPTQTETIDELLEIARVKYADKEEMVELAARFGDANEYARGEAAAWEEIIKLLERSR